MHVQESALTSKPIAEETLATALGKVTDGGGRTGVAKVTRRPNVYGGVVRDDNACNEGVSVQALPSNTTTI